MSLNPALVSFLTKTRSVTAPAIQPAQAASLVVNSGGNSSSRIRSDTVKRPPGRSTR